MKKIVFVIFIISILHPNIQAQEKGNSHHLIFFLAGQSNMDGCGVGEELPAKYISSPLNVRVWDNRDQEWVKLGETTFSKRRSHQFGPEMEFAHRVLQAFPDKQIRIIKTSGGGTKLFNQWIPAGGMYNRFIENITNE